MWLSVTHPRLHHFSQVPSITSATVPDNTLERHQNNPAETFGIVA